ncbi:MAG: Lrp/AsnC family transcriptional regulator [Methanomicrobiaceae archaeon]|nr:Lrp/AsnC family transcriptional regulator [Methanomicrobiaceae archaeon]MDD5420412.1 Lrp/AsnC family transcriptional regulator [Methanomicrobiaceae archaeon]
MDGIDGAILRELQEDGRVTMAELGAKLGIAPSTAFKRIEKLKATGIIERFTIVINQSHFEHMIVAFLNVRVDSDAKPEVERFLRSLPHVVEVYEVLEPGDFIAKAQVHSITELKRDVLIPLSGVAGVRDLQTVLSVKRVKEKAFA